MSIKIRLSRVPQREDQTKTTPRNEVFKSICPTLGQNTIFLLFGQQKTEEQEEKLHSASLCSAPNDLFQMLNCETASGLLLGSNATARAPIKARQIRTTNPIE